jgi:hypothetical protein
MAIRDVRQGEANQGGGQQMPDLLQLVKDAEWSRDRKTSPMGAVWSAGSAWVTLSLI